jgi:hypothetical protein
MSVNKLPLEPYWVNAAMWFVDNRPSDSILQFHSWLRNQGVINLPREQFTPYIEFDSALAATLFAVKWAQD